MMRAERLAARAGFVLAFLQVVGCADGGAGGMAVGREREADRMDAGVDPDAPTWHQDIAPLVVQKCSGCHREDGIAPFSLEKYETARSFAAAMASAVEQGTMPPFLAQETQDCRPKRAWRNDLRLSDAQKKLLRAWADAGAPEGDANAAVELTPPPAVRLEREDVVMTIPREIVVEGKRDLHSCMIVDPKLEKDEYVVGRLITAGNHKVLHHVVSYVIQPGSVMDASGASRPRSKAELEALLKAEKGVGIGGTYDCFGGPAITSTTTEMLDAWAPGGLPNLAPENAGQPIAKDSLVVLDVHYHPTGKRELDSGTKLALMLATSKPIYVSRTVLIGNFESTREVGSANGGGSGALVQQPGEDKAAFMIPAKAEAHVEDMTWTWRLPLGGIRVAGMGTHMHYVGRKMRISLEHKTPSEREDKEECLIETPQWDFNWQRGYGYDAAYTELPEMRDGDVLKLHCEFDNSMHNKFVVQALADRSLSEPVDVKLGEDTLEEMCLAAVGITYPLF
jgi:hypothetical protein